MYNYNILNVGKWLKKKMISILLHKVGTYCILKVFERKGVQWGQSSGVAVIGKSW